MFNNINENPDSNDLDDSDIMALAHQAHLAETVDEYTMLMDAAQMVLSQDQHQQFLDALSRLRSQAVQELSELSGITASLMWVTLRHVDIEALRRFYETYFGGTVESTALDDEPGVAVYILNFAGGMQIQLKSRPNPSETEPPAITHLTFSVGSEAAVEAVTRRLGQDGYQVARSPGQADQGDYHSIVLDPAGNRLEITL